ncbi:hypothetical protein SIXOD_v1c00400 [Spiroplasma ixodetis Y32]|nr:hypothetical protein SIXOD_v1c00400 [Spiroplasma ixodetis Y32]
MENYYLKPNGEKVYGTTTIWWNKFLSPNKTSLYFNTVKEHSEDIKWDGKYIQNYFNK